MTLRNVYRRLQQNAPVSGPAWYYKITKYRILISVNIPTKLRGSDMPKNNYLVFLTVAEKGSFSKAAEQLHYTQSGISKLITSIEKELGVKLFYRSKNGAELTPCGAAIQPYVKEMYRNALLTEESAREFITTYEKTIHLGTFTGVARRWLPDIIKAFRGLHPMDRVVTKNEPVAKLEEDLLGAKLDCAFLPYLSKDGLDIVYLADDPYMAILPAGHRFANRKAVSPKELGGEELILPAEGSSPEFQTILKRFEQDPKISHEMNDDPAAIDMVRAGFGISFLPALSLDGGPPEGTAAVPVRGAQRAIGLASRKGEHKTLALEAFMNMCVAMIRERQ
jgi:DNA-binding transcriptional LysR family regulator